MAVHVDSPTATQIAVLEGRSLIEHYVSRPADDVTQIHGNIYLGRVQNVLPGMEAAFVDIGTPKNAVLYRGDVRYDPEDVDEKGANPRIEQILKARQTDPLPGHQEPDRRTRAPGSPRRSRCPGRFVVLVPNSTTYGISKRLPDNERKRLRQILDKVKPKGHGLIVRTAAEGVTAEELERDVAAPGRAVGADRGAGRQVAGARAALPRARHGRPGHPRGVQQGLPRASSSTTATLYEEVRDYVGSDLARRWPTGSSTTTPTAEPLPLFERYHVHEQLHKALDRKVWLPSGGSLIIEHTEALTVIDVNTGKNVGKSSLEETVFRNNLEAAEEIARQLRLRDIGGIIVIDFIDMEIRRTATR